MQRCQYRPQWVDRLTLQYDNHHSARAVLTQMNALSSSSSSSCEHQYQHRLHRHQHKQHHQHDLHPLSNSGSSRAILSIATTRSRSLVTSSVPSSATNGGDRAGQGGGGWGVMMCGPDEYIGSLCTLAPSTEMCGTHGSSNAVETETRPYLLATPIASEAHHLSRPGISSSKPCQLATPTPRTQATFRKLGYLILRSL